MTLLQPQTKIADFDIMVSRVHEAIKQIREQHGENLYVFLIPLKKEGKNPDVQGRIYVSDPDDESIETPREDCIISPVAARDRLAKSVGNVGIVGFKGISKYSLAFFDFDVEEGHTVIPIEEIMKFVKENDLLAVRTRNGGIHIYVVNDGRFDNAIIEYQGKHAGEIRAHKQYVVAPGSAVPVSDSDEKKPTPHATGVYEVIHDGVVKIVANHQLPSWFAIMNAVPRRKIASLKIDFDAASPYDNKKWLNDLGMSVADICNREDDDTLRDLVLAKRLTNGKFGNDRSGADWFVARKLWWWRFTPQQIVEIMRYYRWYAKTAREDYMEHTVAKASEGAQYKSPEELMRESPSILTDAEKHNVEVFPEELPPKNKVVHLRGLPRGGKSYWGLTQIAKRGEGIYVAPNHEIIEQQFNTFTRRIAPHLTSVWLVGKDRSCITRNEAGLLGDCVNCPLRPVNEYAKEEGSEELTTRRYEEYAMYALSQFHHLTHHVVAENMQYACPYYLLHFAEKFANVCFTVPHFTTVEDSITRCSSRKLMVIDEDTTFQHYQPESVTLLEYTARPGITSTSVSTGSIVDRLYGIKDMIKEKERMPAWDKIILRVIETYEAINKLFETFNDDHKVFGRESGERKENILRELNRLDFAFENLPRDMKTQILDKIAEYEKDIYSHDDTSLREMFEPMLYPYKEKRFVWIGNNPSTLYLVGNKREIIRTPVPCDQYLLIGFTEAELFAKYLLEHGSKLVREPGQQDLEAEYTMSASQYLVREFKYGKNFILVNFVGNTRTQNRLMRTARNIFISLNRADVTRAPFMIITSSMKKQVQLWESIPSDEASMCRKEPIERTYQRYRIGMGAIIYQNSTISRGIDVPWYDVIFVDSCNFAQPYWTAAETYLMDEIDRMRSLLRPIEQLSPAEKQLLGVPAPASTDNNQSSAQPTDPVTAQPAPPLVLSGAELSAIEKRREHIMMNLRLIEEEQKEVMRIRYSLLMDETTNSVLRPSPVPGCGESNTKVIFIKDRDVHLLNPDAKAVMSKYEPNENADLQKVVMTIWEMSQKVNPSALCRKSEGEDESFREFSVPSKVQDKSNKETTKSVQKGESRTKYEDILQNALVISPEVVTRRESRLRDISNVITTQTLKPPKKQKTFRRTLEGVVNDAKRRLKRMGPRPVEITRAVENLVRTGVIVVDTERDESTGERAEYYRLRNDTNKYIEKDIDGVA